MLDGDCSSKVAVHMAEHLPAPAPAPAPARAGLELSGANADEEELLAACVRGEGSAMRALYDRHARVVMARARRLGLAADEAEDVTQEVFAAAFENVSKIRAGALGAFLFRLTSNRVTDRFRRRRVRDAFARWFGASEPDVTFEGPEATALRRDAERHVGSILARMSPKKRDVFALFELEGASGEEIAAALQIPVDTVWTRLHHARLEFAKIGRGLKLLDDLGRSGGGP
jgi:RNA polymerase sigma-70 factor (ECF subfamily)